MSLRGSSIGLASLSERPQCYGTGHQRSRPKTYCLEHQTFYCEYCDACCVCWTEGKQANVCYNHALTLTKSHCDVHGLYFCPQCSGTSDCPLCGCPEHQKATKYCQRHKFYYCPLCGPCRHCWPHLKDATQQTEPVEKEQPSITAAFCDKHKKTQLLLCQKHGFRYCPECGSCPRCEQAGSTATDEESQETEAEKMSETAEVRMLCGCKRHTVLVNDKEGVFYMNEWWKIQCLFRRLDRRVPALLAAYQRKHSQYITACQENGCLRHELAQLQHIVSKYIKAKRYIRSLPCATCGKPVGNRWLFLGDRHVICNTCHQTYTTEGAFD